MIYIGSNSNAKELKDFIIDYLKNEEFEVLDLSSDDIYEVTCQIAHKVLENRNEHKGIVIDEYGVIPFMLATKHKGIICAELNDEHSAKMTRDHNNSNMISLGSYVVGNEVALGIAKRFVNGKYAGGRHQIRVDMLDKMG